MRDQPTFLHVDMDAFFASVEILERPDLANEPVVVGGNGARGVVASCNYEARRYGIRSAMPSVRARALCPHAVFLPGRYNDYERYGSLMREILMSFTPLVEPVSIDEAFLDVEGARALFGDPHKIAWAIRGRIHDELKLGASVGAATTKHLAKLASEAAKPVVTDAGVKPGKRVFVIDKQESIPFLHPLPVRALWGVGPVTAAKIERLGIETVGQLAHSSREALSASLGQHTADHLQDLAWNRDARSVEPTHSAKSVGHEQTFATNLYSIDEIHECLVRLADAVASRLRKAHLAGRTVTVKVRFSDFRTITRSLTVADATSSGSVIAKTAGAAISALDTSSGIRLLGVSLSNLEEVIVVEQLELDPGGPPDSRLDRTIDDIRSRYGADAVVPALLVKDGEARVLRPGERQWGPNAQDDPRPPA